MYCESSHISGEFKGITFSASTAVTSTQVERFIEEADAEIDAKVGLKYVTPVTGTESLKVLRSISIAIVASRVRAILEVKTADSRTEQAVRGGDPAKVAREKLDQIVKGTLLLSDASLRSSGQGMRSFNSDNAEEHTFKKNRDQW